MPLINTIPSSQLNGDSFGQEHFFFLLNFVGCESDFFPLLSRAKLVVFFPSLLLMLFINAKFEHGSREIKK